MDESRPSATSTAGRRIAVAGVSLRPALLLVSVGAVTGVLLVCLGWLVIGRQAGRSAAPALPIGNAVPSRPALPCRWVTPGAAYMGDEIPPTGTPTRTPVGTPTDVDVPASGQATMTVTTNLGLIEIRMDRAATPCTVASFAYLARQGFFDGTPCHRLAEQPTTHLLQCGDPTGTGEGTPGYVFVNENQPSVPQPPGIPFTAFASPVVRCPSPSGDIDPCVYVAAPDLMTFRYGRGVVGLANVGQRNNGSQFFITYRESVFSRDEPYSVFGVVTRGMQIVDRVAAAGVDDASGSGDGRPRLALMIRSVTVS